MSEFKIIDNIEMPERRGRGVTKYPWSALKVGQGFEVPVSGQKQKNGQDKCYGSLNSCSRLWARKHCPAARFQIAQVGDVIRVKRIA